jgi:hypothetical protein
MRDKKTDVSILHHLTLTFKKRNIGESSFQGVLLPTHSPLNHHRNHHYPLTALLSGNSYINSQFCQLELILFHHSTAKCNTLSKMPFASRQSTFFGTQFWVNSRAILIQTEEYLLQEDNASAQHLHTITQRLVELQSSLHTLHDTVPAATLESWTSEVERLTLALQNRAAQIPSELADRTSVFPLDIGYELSYPSDQAGQRGRGRPSKVPDTAQVLQALSMGFTAREIAKSQGNLSESTLNRHIKRMQLRAKNYLPDEQLDLLVQQALQDVPNSGYRAVCAWLRSSQIVVTERAVQASIGRVDPTRIRTQAIQALPRRIKYWVPSPNSVWHFDGNHKLNRWGFVTHGCVDGYSRRLMWLEVKTDNYASSVLGSSPLSCLFTLSARVFKFQI